MKWWCISPSSAFWQLVQWVQSVLQMAIPQSRIMWVFYIPQHFMSKLIFLILSLWLGSLILPELFTSFQVQACQSLIPYHCHISTASLTVTSLRKQNGNFFLIWGAIPHWLLWWYSHVKMWQPCFPLLSCFKKKCQQVGTFSWAMRPVQWNELHLKQKPGIYWIMFVIH